MNDKNKMLEQNKKLKEEIKSLREKLEMKDLQ